VPQSPTLDGPGPASVEVTATILTNARPQSGARGPEAPFFLSVFTLAGKTNRDNLGPDQTRDWLPEPAGRGVAEETSEGNAEQAPYSRLRNHRRANAANE